MRIFKKYLMKKLNYFISNLPYVALFIALTTVNIYLEKVSFLFLFELSVKETSFIF